MGEDDPWIEFYKKTYNQFRENAKFSWDMVKWYTITSFGFVTITLTSVGAILSNEYLMRAPQFAGFVIMCLSIFPIFMFITLCIGKRNFKRECEHHYQQLAIIMKLEDDKIIKHDERKNLNDNFFSR
jgi:Mn2+/Fe2+ NRAMP family transporter